MADDKPLYTRWRCDRCGSRYTTVIPASAAFHNCKGKSEPYRPDPEEEK